MDEISRRTLLTGTALGGAALLGGARALRPGGAAAQQAPPPGRTRTHPVRAAVLPPLSKPWSPQRRDLGPDYTNVTNAYYDYRHPENREFFRRTGTTHLRLFADWARLQPRPEPADPSTDRQPFGNGDPLSPADHWRALDGQIEAAVRDGLVVILTVYRFTGWANGTDDPKESWDDPEHRQGKEPEFRVPQDLSPEGPYGRFLAMLIERYGPASHPRTITYLEVCNEPELQWWPQLGPAESDGDTAEGVEEPIIHRAVAQVFQTAKQVRDRHSAQTGGVRLPILLGPGSSDAEAPDPKTRTDITIFLDKFLDKLSEDGFEPGSSFAWSHHNYRDVELDRGAGSQLGQIENLAAQVRQTLINRGWEGLPAGLAGAPPDAPWVFITEGGALPEKIMEFYGVDRQTALQKQAELITRNWDRHTGRLPGTGPEDEGIAMLSQYLIFSEPNYDSGMLDPPELGGKRRPAYDAWGKLGES